MNTECCSITQEMKYISCPQLEEHSWLIFTGYLGTSLHTWPMRAWSRHLLNRYKSAKLSSIAVFLKWTTKTHFHYIFPCLPSLCVSGLVSLFSKGGRTWSIVQGCGKVQLQARTVSSSTDLSTLFRLSLPLFSRSPCLYTFFSYKSLDKMHKLQLEWGPKLRNLTVFLLGDGRTVMHK